MYNHKTLYAFYNGKNHFFEFILTEEYHSRDGGKIWSFYGRTFHVGNWIFLCSIPEKETITFEEFAESIEFELFAELFADKILKQEGC